MPEFPKFSRMGEAALLVELGDTIDAEVNSRVHSLARLLSPVVGIVKCVPGYASLLVEFDPLLLSDDELEAHVRAVLEAVGTSPSTDSRTIEIPTRYGGEFGPDLEFVAQRNGLTPPQVIALHTAQPFRVFMLGFSPGFPYAGPLPERLNAPRLDTPRPHVPAGSVAIAGQQTGIYPFDSPGGWRLIGRTDVVLFDPTRDPPALLRPGDYIRFVSV